MTRAFAILPALIPTVFSKNFGFADLWCDIAFEDCITNKETSICGKPENAEIGFENLCKNDHCATRFSQNEMFQNFCSDFKSVSHCPPGGCVSYYDMTPIWNYGCWCNFGEHLLKGSGDPVNKPDQFCRSLQLCLRCAKWDGANDPQPYNCIPSEQTYTSSQIGSHYEVDCSSNNSGDSCAEHVCSCNYHFVTSLFTLTFDTSYSYDDSFLHTNNFDHKKKCGHSLSPKQPGNGGPGSGNGGSPKIETACCGQYPKRYHYDVNSPTKSCCNEHFLYNPLGQQCCNGDSVVPIGTCI